MTFYHQIKLFSLFFILLFSVHLIGQESPLKLAEIMQGNNFIGQQPFDFKWDANSEQVYFKWNPNTEIRASYYQYSLKEKQLSLINNTSLKQLPINGFIKEANGEYRFYKTKNAVYKRENNIDELIYRTTEQFSIHSIIENTIIIQKNQNLYALNTDNKGLIQLTNFISGKNANQQTIKETDFLTTQQDELFKTLKTKQAKNKANHDFNTEFFPDFLKPFSLNEWKLNALSIAPKLDQIVFTTYQGPQNEITEYTEFITKDGYSKTKKARSKVGGNNPQHQLFIWNFLIDSFQIIDFSKLTDYNRIPAYYKNYAKFSKDLLYEKELIFHLHGFNKSGDKCLIEIKSYDNKDRWIGYIDLKKKAFIELEHQHDEKWIGGPGISGWNMVAGNVGWIDNSCFYFQSEATGYSHLYSFDILTGLKKTLTSGDFEIHKAELSNDKKQFYITANKNHAGNREFYSLDIASKDLTPLLTADGNHEVLVSPNEKWLLVNYSYKNKPWDLYIAPNKKNTELSKITDSQREDFKDYAWREPPIITFTASDGQKVNARIYEPTNEVKNGAAVFFVHGAGYLQNAHNWWSGYYREFMFNNMLCDMGFTIIDVDYRASKGYGRDFRTAIYRNMGGKDLSDHLDARNYLIENYAIDSNRIGIYGGSYGGFITLMALLKEPGKFQCGAAIRSVTDWAHYNHPYTSNILNTPDEDSIAFRRSSPIYYADNLEDKLLMLHGMVDDNVQYQDVVRLSQRFIELGKTNWDLIGYPVEPHGFLETTSWVDEYGRILKLFQEELLVE